MYRVNGIVMAFPLGDNKGLLPIWLWENLGYVHSTPLFCLFSTRIASARVHMSSCSITGTRLLSARPSVVLEANGAN